ncbi:MAG: 30S ribosome-binding factor RbfA [Eggerthellaceae bacterium]
MKQGASSRRVNEQARQVIAEIVMFEINDPRLDLVTITGCEVSFDRSVCNVYFTAEKGTYESVQKALEAASGRIRSLMGRKLPWRMAPELRFFLDKSVDQAERIAIAIQHERKRNAELEAERQARKAGVAGADANEKVAEEGEDGSASESDANTEGATTAADGSAVSDGAADGAGDDEGDRR